MTFLVNKNLYFMEVYCMAITNREYLTTCCDRGDLATINRYMQRILAKRVKAEDPIWTKEEQYNKILSEPFDIVRFEAARLDKDGHARPENYYYEYSVATPKKKKGKKS
jgi:hypothetical protein